ncbi:MAG: lysophospholipid acyltransferase family protein [Coriobacteriales bacterium]
MKSLDEIFDSGVWVPKGKPRNWFIYVAAYFVRPILKVCFRWKIRGVENLEAIGDEPVVYVCNHVSYADPCVHWCAFYGQKRFSRILARATLFKPVLAQLIARVGAIPINPDSADRTAIKRAVACLRRGESLLIYPEGTRMNKPNKVYHPHAGAILIANMGKARIVPIGIEGTEKIMPYGKPKFIRFPRVYLNVGKPIDPKGERFANLPKEGKSDAIIAEIMDEVFRLRDTARG